MTVSAETPAVDPLERSRSNRSGHELAVELVYGPLARVAVWLLLPLRVPPPAVVLAHAATGLVGVVALVRGELVLAALLLQAKTVLDNADGKLARESGRASLLGRYLDTEADFVVNAALFAALGYVTGQPWLALAAFCVLTLLLSIDFNVDRIYSESRGEARADPAASGGRLEGALEGSYRIVFASQDRLVRAIVSARLERILSSTTSLELRNAATLAYNDRLTVVLLSNLGLSTQLAVLGLCLAIGYPATYLWLVLASAALLPLLQLRRERLARLALSRERSSYTCATRRREG